ncbi:MAG: CPBP family intramembrane metalloprotease [Clostridia bacterium]|nr:CPBP family intramembrane metalloprotease [Clostridia bacterium]
MYHNGIYEGQQNIEFISSRDFISECGDNCVDEDKAAAFKLEIKSEVFSKKIGRLMIAYIFFIVCLFLAGLYPYFIAETVFDFFSLFGESAKEVYFALKLDYICSLLRNVLIFFPLFIYYLSERRTLSGITKQKEMAVARIPAAFIFVTGALFAVNIILSLVSQAFYSPSDSASELPGDTFGIVITFISTALIPAFIEEFFFRHVILRSMLPYNKFFAVLISSLLFGLAHFPVDQKIFALFFGIIIGFIYVKTESVFPGIIFHLLNNSFSVFQTYVSTRGSDQLKNAVSCFILITVYLSLFIGIFYIFNYKASPFYSGGKEFDDITLSSEEISGRVLRSKAVYVMLAVYFIVTVVIFACATSTS